MNISPESRKFAEEEPPYPQEVKEAWTNILISCWKEEGYIDALRSDPLVKLLGNPTIDQSEGKYFPLPSKPPGGVPNPDTVENETALRDILKENFPHFGQMMMGGGWSENDGEAWVDIIVRAWKESEFLQLLRNNPKEALKDYPRISASLGKFFPISKDLPKDLEGSSEDELRRKLNAPDAKYMGWMMACCR